MLWALVGPNYLYLLYKVLQWLGFFGTVLISGILVIGKNCLKKSHRKKTITRRPSHPMQNRRRHRPSPHPSPLQPRHLLPLLHSKSTAAFSSFSRPQLCSSPLPHPTPFFHPRKNLDGGADRRRRERRLRGDRRRRPGQDGQVDGAPFLV